MSVHGVTERAHRLAEGSSVQPIQCHHGRRAYEPGMPPAVVGLLRALGEAHLVQQTSSRGDSRIRW